MKFRMIPRNQRIQRIRTRRMFTMLDTETRVLLVDFIHYRTMLRLA